MNAFSPSMPGLAAFPGLCWALVSPPELPLFPPRHRDQPHTDSCCLRGQNKISPKTACKGVPNPQPRLHELSNCGLWDRAWCFRLLVTFHFSFSADVGGRLVAGLAVSRRDVQDSGPGLTCSALPSHSPHNLPWFWSFQFPFESFPSLLRYLRPILLLTFRLVGTRVIN